MENANDSHFHKLINLQRNSQTVDTMALIVDNKLICDTEDQTEAWALYCEQLSSNDENITPQHQTLNIAKINSTIFANIMQSNSIQSEPDTEEEVRCAISKLQHGKSADDFGISSEHFKNTAETLTPILTMVFNAIRNTRHISLCFKTSRITVICKKGKPETDMDSYLLRSVSGWYSRQNLGTHLQWRNKSSPTGMSKRASIWIYGRAFTHNCSTLSK